MLAYEFQTVVNNGIIQIPLEYRDKVSNRVKVILLSEESQTQLKEETPFTAMKLDTKGFVLDREYANER